jgi:hypothetical protein
MPYTADQLRALRAQGHAMPPTPGSSKPASYPIDNLSDLDSAIGLARTPAQRLFITKRAKALGASSKIPDSWNTDGSHK